MSAPLLRVRDLKRHFRLRGGWPWSAPRVLRAVDGVSFELEAGQTLGLVGESGCGKSTLGRTILQLTPATSGSVQLNGQELTTLDARALKTCRKKMQMIFQDPYASLPPRRTVGQILHEPLDWHGIGEKSGRADRVASLLERVGLGASALNRYPHAFSGGQRQRIGIARALAVEPELVVADEPVSALDVSVQSQILNLLADLKDELGLALLFISHDLAVVQHIADRVAVMYLGRIVEYGPVARIYSAPAHPYTQALLDAVPVPSPDGRVNRPVLVGEVPSPVNPPSGCAFHTRCPHAMPVCRSMEPRVIRIGNEGESHSVRCHLHDPEVEQ